MTTLWSRQLMLLLASLIWAGCTRIDRVVDRVEVDKIRLVPADVTQTVTQDGGVDSSGGNLARSADKDFSMALEEGRKNLKTIFHRLSAIYFSKKYSYHQVSTSNPLDNAQGLMTFSGNPTNGKEWVKTEALTAALHPTRQKEIQNKIDSLRFQVQDTDCTSDNGHKDASANSKGQVCLNKESIKRIPPKQIGMYLAALLAHETAHVIGLGEGDAQIIQDFLTAFPALTQAEPAIIKRLDGLYVSKIYDLIRGQYYFKKWLQYPDTDRFDFYCETFSSEKNPETNLVASLEEQKDSYGHKRGGVLLHFSEVFERTSDLLVENKLTSETSKEMAEFCKSHKGILNENQIPEMGQMFRALIAEFERSLPLLIKVYNDFRKQAYLDAEPYAPEKTIYDVHGVQIPFKEQTPQQIYKTTTKTGDTMNTGRLKKQVAQTALALLTLTGGSSALATSSAAPAVRAEASKNYSITAQAPFADVVRAFENIRNTNSNAIKVDRNSDTQAHVHLHMYTADKKNVSHYNDIYLLIQAQGADKTTVSLQGHSTIWGHKLSESVTEKGNYGFIQYVKGSSLVIRMSLSAQADPDDDSYMFELVYLKVRGGTDFYSIKSWYDEEDNNPELASAVMSSSVGSASFPDKTFGQLK